jgi:aminopeptidase 2
VSTHRILDKELADDRSFSLDVKKETSTITLNMAELELGTASIHSDILKTEQTQTGRVSDATAQRVALSFRTPLPSGSKAQLKIGFKGMLTGSMMGYYKSSWEHEGKTKHYTLTQFEVCDLVVSSRIF